MKKNENGFSAVEIIIVIVILGLVGTVGWLVYDRHKSKTDNKTNQTNQQEAKQETPNKQNNASADLKTNDYLEIKEYGVKLELSKEIKDAYYEIENGFPYLSVHSLDKYRSCKKVAVVSKAKAGDDNMGSRWTKQELEERSTLQIGDTYYWVTPGNGGSCSDPTGNNADEAETNARREFSSAKLLKL